jgi:UDP-N-acetylglucosamine 2-epimerase (non-hydrolysing)
VTAASQLLSDPSAYEAMATAINPFGDGHAAERILGIVKNYFGL